MGDELRAPKIFISAVTSEFGPLRQRLVEILAGHGASVAVQQRYPSQLADGEAIARTIKASDLAIFLIGDKYGVQLPANDLPEDVPPWYSWTEWECHLRRTAEDYLLLFYNGPPIGKPETEELSNRQIEFKNQITAEEKGSYEGKFRFWFKSADDLEACIVQFCERSDGALALFRAGTWAKIRAQYRSHAVKAWQTVFTDPERPLEHVEPGAGDVLGTNVYRGKQETSPAEKQKLLTAKQAPFIASQGFRILEPKGGKQMHALRPAAFLPGRSSEIEALAREDSTWNPLKREALKQALLDATSARLELGGVQLARPVRLFLVSGGGVGKTTNMRWLDAVLNASGNDAARPAAEGASAGGQERKDDGRTAGSAADAQTPVTRQGANILAIRINAGALLNLNDDEILAELTSRIAAEVGAGDSKWALDAIRHGLLADAEASQLVFLIDGLDHIETGKVPFFRSIQSNAPGHRWSRCCVVAAGRPHALQGWKEDRVGSEDAIAVGQWRFVEPLEFLPDEAEVFLGVTDDGHSRYSLVANQLGGLARVPRVLEYVRTLDAKRLEGVRTSADIYQRSLRELIKRTLKAGGKTTRMIGPRWQEDCERAEPPNHQVGFIMRFLAVLAFLSLCPMTEADFAPVDESRRSEAFKMSISEDVRRFMRERLVAPGEAPYSTENLDRDFEALAGFASIIGNGVLDDADSDDGGFNSLVWSNRTIQQFLAAYWFAVHAGGFEALTRRLAGQTVETSPDDPQRDAERLRLYVFYPEDAKSDVTYELNMFLAEMPASTPLSCSSWVASASAWYDPDLHGGTDAGASVPRKWSTEMLYRSWATMHDIAGYPYDDWWDLPYQSLIATASGFARAAKSLHQQRNKSGLDGNSSARSAARKVLNRFYDDFGAILQGARGEAQQRAAQEMIEEKNWLEVPAGTFRMGAPLCKQGFPPKVKAYWLHDLDDVQTGQLPADAVARRSTPRDWFTGAQGKLLRDEDIQWLTEAFRVVEPPPNAARAAPDRNAPEYKEALQTLEAKWSRRDETPAENPQQISGFFMHQLPILHRWYYLFAPSYRATVAAYLQPTPHPADDHPAIYISWCDAWAFCQWANWTAPDAGGGRRRYGLRLPHEAEWEYAARWNKPDANQPPQQVNYGQRYWWGDAFYKHEAPDDEKSAKPEPISDDRAHAIGSPGGTRAPAKAAPNGLGFRDILGNVWEWTANVYETRREADEKVDDVVKYSRTYPTDRAPVNCLRTMRGGLWYYLDLLANCTARFRLYSDDRDYKMGFRAVREERWLR